MATWTNEEQYYGQPSITYNQAVIYDTPVYNYNGVAVTIWTNETKS